MENCMGSFLSRGDGNPAHEGGIVIFTLYTANGWLVGFRGGDRNLSFEVCFYKYGKEGDLRSKRARG